MKPVKDMNNEEISRLTTAVLNSVKAALPKDTGFAVLYAPFTVTKEEIPCQWGTNVQRADMILMLRETADRLEMDPATRKEYLENLLQQWSRLRDVHVAEMVSGVFGTILAMIQDSPAEPVVPNEQKMNHSVFMQNYAQRDRSGCIASMKIMLRDWLARLESA